MAEPVFDAGIIPTGYERTLPPELQLLVRARRRIVFDRARGRVLDLGGADTHHALWRASTRVDDVTLFGGAPLRGLEGLLADGERFDTIVSVFQLASAVDLDGLIGQLTGLLAEDGQLLFLEPGRQVGVSGRLQRVVTPGLALLAGWRVDRDIPATLRDHDLSVIDLERHRVPTMLWWLRQLDEGRARHALLSSSSPTG